MFASEVKKIMQYLREESLQTILSAVGEKRIISALGKQKLLSAMNKDDLIAALGGSENLLKTLLATLKPEQMRDMLEATGRN